jgi:hypothetical protein
MLHNQYSLKFTVSTKNSGVWQSYPNIACIPIAQSLPTSSAGLQEYVVPSLWVSFPEPGFQTLEGGGSDRTMKCKNLDMIHRFG